MRIKRFISALTISVLIICMVGESVLADEIVSETETEIVEEEIVREDILPVLEEENEQDIISADSVANSDEVQMIYVEPEFLTNDGIEVHGGWGNKQLLKEADAEARNVVNRLIDSNMCDLQKLFVLAEYLNSNVEYGIKEGSTNRGQTAYEALILKKSVCAGNAAAFNMLTYYAGINSNYLMSSSLNHAFTEVEINGNWYVCDPQNARANSSFLMSVNTNRNYRASDIKDDASYDITPYNYSQKVETITADTTFDNVDFLKMKILEKQDGYTRYTFVLDWDTFKNGLIEKGIDPATLKPALTPTKKPSSSGNTDINVSKLSIKFSKTPFDYEQANSETGITPLNLTIKSGVTNLLELSDFSDKFTLTFDNNRAVGKASLTLTAKDKSGYTGSVTKYYNIVGTKISKAKIVNLPKSEIYNGTLITQNFGVSENSVHLTLKLDKYTTKTLQYVPGNLAASDYSVEYVYKKGPNVGTVQIVIKGNEARGYQGTMKKNFKIVPVVFSPEDKGFSITGIEDKTFTGEKITQNPVVKYTFENGNTVTLEENVDYRVQYKNNTKVSPAGLKSSPAVIFRGKGNYKNALAVDFAIKE